MRGVNDEPFGFSCTEDFLDLDTEKELLTYLSSVALEPLVIRGNAAKRTVRHFGLRYDYSSQVLREADPIPSEFQPQIERAEMFAGLPQGSLVEALVNRYPAGASVGWHNDAPVYKSIIGISLRTPCTIEFRTRRTENSRRFERRLMSRSAYIMRDAARDDWQHCIPPTKGERFSLTLRSLAS